MSLGRIGGWVGAGLAEAAGRLVILSGTTAYLAHALTPGDFGASALCLSVVTIFAMFVGTPYEEALTQARVVRRADLAAVLALALVAALALALACVPVGALMDWWYGRFDLVLMLPATGLLLFAQGPLSVATAVARRRKAFYAINVSNLVGHGAGAAAAIALGHAGGGVWALIALRVVLVLMTTVSLFVQLRLAVAPRWSWRRLAALNRFAGVILATRLVENATYLVYNLLVGGLFGLTVLGYLNVAMRLVEPVRGAIVAITHNICFPHFLKASGLRTDLGGTAARISAETTALIAPTFMGLAAVGPILVPLMAGTGWEDAVPIAAALAAGGMLALPSQVVQTALSAGGRPQHVLLSNVIGLAALILVLLAAAGTDHVAVGLARLAGDGAQTLVTLVVGGRLIGLRPGPLLRGLVRIWLAAGVMAAAVVVLGAQLLADQPRALALVTAISAGIVLYGPLLFLCARPSASALLRLAGPLLGARIGARLAAAGAVR
ncbi:oligosaccharide flippase family protein [Methylobacterium sp. NEAU K]|uniref:oligosaccharide flippase family protein n=1 Tax=Methylobacterium sp. NEAU K TaxID=3064946 RepID=UPI0027359776|nr:oligosaccharide flippase family protein [Methylobacterium sp. NEAU K]MDP4006132.1 oligosaccharide flippase family protein [Methylobacterium sp. NEAU K]